MSKKNRSYQLRIIISGLAVVLFLSASIKYIKKHEEDKKLTKNIENVLSTYFDELYDSYESYINLVVNEIEESYMYTTATDVYVAYVTLQNNGLISLGDEFNPVEPDFSPIGNSGISIPLGEGVCRNQASNLYNIFNKLGYDCGLVAGEIYVGKANGETNHEVVYVKDRGYVYLFDPANKTVFLRNIYGKFISIYDEELMFRPSISDNEVFNNIKGDYSFYFYSSDDYSNAIECRHHMNESFEKVHGVVGYYKEFEEKYLKEIEEDISLEVEEYKKLEKEFKNNN